MAGAFRVYGGLAGRAIRVEAGRAFLRREELPDGFTLALAAVETVNAGGRQLYVAGGQQLDQDFLDTLVLPEGMRVLLYRNLEPRFAPRTCWPAPPAPRPMRRNSSR